MASEAFVEAVGIDPSSYPTPTFPPTSCPARSRATGSVSAHLQESHSTGMTGHVCTCLP